MARKSFGGSSSFGETWKPGADADGNRREVFDPAVDYIEGYLLKVEDKRLGTNERDSRIYSFQIAGEPGKEYTGFGNNGDTVTVFGCTVLDNKMNDFIKDVGEGGWARVEWLGMELRSAAKQIQKTQPKKIFESKDYVKLYAVYSDDAIPSIKVEGQVAYTPAATNAAQATTAPRPETPAQNKPAPAATNIFEKKLAEVEPVNVPAAAPPAELADDDDEEALPF